MTFTSGPYELSITPLTLSQQKRDIDPMLGQWCTSVVDGEPTLIQQ